MVVCAWTCLSAFCTHPRVQGTLANTRLRVALKTLTEKQVKQLSVERSPSRKKQLATSGHREAQKGPTVHCALSDSGLSALETSSTRGLPTSRCLASGAPPQAD